MNKFGIFKGIFNTSSFLAPLVAIGAIACGDDKIELKDTVNVNDFETSGSDGRATIKLKSSKQIASQLEVRYFQGPSAPTDDKLYKIDAPVNLKNGDVVFAKLFVNESNNQKYTIKSQGVKIIVENLTIKIALNDQITSSDFVFSGQHTLGTVALSGSKVLSNQAEVRYYVGQIKPTDDTSYTVSNPQNLKNGTIIYAKLFVKNAFESTYEIINDIPITLNVAGLLPMTINANLEVRNFVLLGTINGVSSIALKPEVTLVNPAIEIRYFVGENAPSDINSFTSLAPNNLSNGNKVWIKPFIKQDEINNYHLITSQILVFNVIGLKTLLNETINLNDFTTSGAHTNGTITFNKATLASQLEVRYFKGSNLPSDESAFLASAPNDLKNGDKVYAKLFVKTSDASLYSVADSIVTIMIANLDKFTLTDTIEIANFEVAGNNGVAQIGLKSPAPLLHSALEIRYFKGSTLPNDDSSFTTNAPSSLSIGDKVWIKLFVKASEVANYQIAEHALEFDVANLVTILSDTLVVSDFKIEGTHQSGNLTFERSNLATQLEVRYFKGENPPTDENLYQTTIPTNLSNGDVIYIRLFVKTVNQNLYTVSNQVTRLVIVGLTPITLSEALDTSDFETTGISGEGVINRKSSAIAINTLLEIRYFVGTNEPINTSDYQMNATKLSNGQKVWIKLFVKASEVANYQINEPALAFEVANLMVILQDTIEADNFTQSGQHTSGTIVFNQTNLAAQLEVRYAKASVEPIDLTIYQTNVPNDLKNGDIVFARLFVKNDQSDKYTLASGSQVVVMIAINQLGKKELTATIDIDQLSFASGINNLKAYVYLGAPLDNSLEMRFFVGNDAPQNLSLFTLEIPSTLTMGDKIWVKLNVKSEFSQNFTLNFSPVSKVITEPFRTLINFAFNKDNLELIGNYYGDDSVIFRLHYKDRELFQAIPEQLELKYGTSNSASLVPSDDQFVSISTNRDNKEVWINKSETVWLKLFLRSEFSDTHYYESQAFIKPVLVTHIGISTVGAINITKEGDLKNVTLTGDVNGEATLTIGTINEPEVSEIRFFVGDLPPVELSNYKPTRPTNLKNGDKIWMRFFIKDAYINTHREFNIATVFLKVVSGLSTKTFSNTIDINKITITGGNTQGIIKYESPSPFLEARFFLGTSEPTNNNSYERFLGQLKDGDKVWIKLFIVNNDPNFVINTMASMYQVAMTSHALNSSLNVNHFELEGSDGSGTLVVKTNAFSDKLEPRFFVGTSKPTNESQYTNVIPSTLNNGDLVWVKLFVKPSETSYTLMDEKVISFQVYMSIVDKQFEGVNFTNTTNARGLLLGNGITSIPDYAFNWSKLPLDFALPKNITDIGIGAFANSTIATPVFYKFSDRLNIISNLAFAQAKLLASGLSVPPSVEYIRSFVFLDVILPQDFQVYQNQRVWREAFTNATLPIGFKIPNFSHIYFKDAFRLGNVKLPFGASWFNPNTQKWEMNVNVGFEVKWRFDLYQTINNNFYELEFVNYL